MNKVVLFLFLIVGFQSFAEDSEFELAAPDYAVDSVSANPKLAEGQSKVVVRITSKFSKKTTLLYGYGDGSIEAELNNKNSFEFNINSGEHVLQFYPLSKLNYAEITTLPIEIKSQTTTYISLNFKQVIERTGNVKKPIIYLYPTEKTEVSVAVNPAGEMSFTYPEYDDKWECTAFPSGEILIDSSRYNYLFWESEQNVDRKILDDGTLVAKENLVLYLEEALDKFGFNSKEKMDFITFWAPQMLKYETTNVRFILNEDCNQFADLEIEPAPDNLVRFYIIWQPIHGKLSLESKPQEIPTCDRSGFTVFEWGGMEVPLRKNYETAEN